MDKGDIYYYVRYLPKIEQYDIVQVKLRTVTDKYYVGVFTDGSRQTVLFSDNDLNNLAFYNFGDAKERLTNTHRQACGVV